MKKSNIQAINDCFVFRKISTLWVCLWREENELWRKRWQRSSVWTKVLRTGWNKIETERIMRRTDWIVLLQNGYIIITWTSVSHSVSLKLDSTVMFIPSVSHTDCVLYELVQSVSHADCVYPRTSGENMTLRQFIVQKIQTVCSLTVKVVNLLLWVIFLFDKC